MVVDKPAGITSHDVVNAVRRIAGTKKAGHTGTLDPFATGVLAVALGEGTKAIPFLDESRKEYRAVMRLGESTDTQDLTGTVTAHGDWNRVTADDLERVIAGYRGKISQIPPMFSALKRNGVPLYKLARGGGEIPREAREIEISALDIESLDLPFVTVSVCCSRGTYVRTLAHDIGLALGCGAHLVALQRTRSGPFTLSAALPLDRLREMAAGGDLAQCVTSPHDALGHLPDLQVNDHGRTKVANGIAPGWDDFTFLPALPCREGEKVRISRHDRLLAVAEIVSGSEGLTRLLRVFNDN